MLKIDQRCKWQLLHCSKNFQLNVIFFPLKLCCRLAVCELSGKACETMASFLQSSNSLTHLDMSNNNISDSGVQQLSEGLCHPNCNLQILRFVIICCLLNIYSIYLYLCL